MSTTEDDYNALPYQSHPFAMTQPSRLGAVAHMFGHEPAPPSSARVLEIGCASGGNILPLALRYPHAAFTGIELAERHTTMAADTIEALGLTNVTIRQGDITDAGFGPDAFDYILCHGVFSWVPETAQNAILRVAAESLTPGGLLYISYNILPGWHLRAIVRDICLFHAGTGGEPELRVARARRALEQMAKGAEGDSPYGQQLRHEARQCATMTDSYILGEFLSDHNAPCYFHEFAARAQTAGLAYLSETEISASLLEFLPKDMAQMIREIAGENGLAQEQYIDFFQGRQFRSSVLTRADQARQSRRALAPGRIADLHLASPWKEDLSASGTDGTRFTNNEAASTLVKNPAVLAVLRFLETVAPETRTPAEVHAHLTSLEAKLAKAPIGATLKLLFNLMMSGRLAAHTDALRCGRASDSMPRIFALACQQVAEGQTWVTSRDHRSLAISQNSAALFALIDGTRSQGDLRTEIADGLQGGRILPGGVQITADASRDAIESAAARILGSLLITLEKSALLDPAD